jgi:PAS domain S-box-containing protein
MILIDLIYNLSVLFALSTLSGFIGIRLDRKTVWGKVLQGLLFGTIAIVGMIYPFNLVDGVIIDGRSIVISICTLFFGPVSGLISAMMASTYRLYLGGGGTITGISVVTFSFLIGYLFNYFIEKGKLQLSKTLLYIFGLLVSAAMMTLMLTLPQKFVSEAYLTISMTVMIFYPLITLLVGKVIIDQFENRKYYEVLVSEKNRYQTTLYSIGDAVIVTDKKGNVTHLNPIAEKLTGWLEKESIGKPLNKVFRIINEYSREEVPNPVTRVLAEGIIIGLANHTLLIHKNGNEFPIADSGAPIKDDQGNIVGVVLVFRDQLEEREQQKILEESEHRFRAIVENAPEPIFIQTNKKFAYLNPSACRLFKIQDQSELIGTPIIERFHPDYHSKIGERIQVLNIERQPVDTHLELKAFRIDGSEVWVETAGAPINYNNENGALVFMRDISERKKNEAIIRESEERIKFALETSNIGAWELDLIDHSANRSLIHDQIFGYKELLPVWTYEMFISHVHPEDRDYVDNRFQTAVKIRQDWNFECRIFRVDGELRWIWAAGRQIFIDKKNPRKLAGIVQDITERKKIELAVKESEEKYRTLIEVSREAIFINYNDKIVYLNPTAVILLGAENEDQIIGKSPFEIFHSDFHETIRERIIRMLEKNESVPLIEEKIIRLDGKLVDVEVSATPFLYRGEQAIQVVLRDITERKLAEQELRTSEKIFTHSIDMLCIAGFDGYFKVLNPSWSKVLGWSTEELLSKPWNDFVHPEDILKTDNIKSTIVDGKEIYQFENRYICKDGSIKCVPILYSKLS